MLGANTTLRIKDVTRARTNMERLICDILQKEGPLTASELAGRVAQGMYYEALKDGAWVVDIGIWGPSLCRREALALLDDMTDRCLAVEGKNNK